MRPNDANNRHIFCTTPFNDVRNELIVAPWRHMTQILVDTGSKMACFLMTLSHYLNQCRPIINVVLWRSDSLRWRHNGRDSVSNHQPHDCLLNCLFRRRSKKHQSAASLAFVRGILRGPVNSPRKWPVAWKMFPFDDVIVDTWAQFHKNAHELRFLSVTCVQRLIFLNYYHIPQRTNAFKAKWLFILYSGHPSLCHHALNQLGEDCHVTDWPESSHRESENNLLTSNGSWCQGIKGGMTCTVYVALVW